MMTMAEVGAGAQLATCQRAYRGEADAGVGHGERDILAGRIPQLSEALHGQFCAGFALGRTIPVNAVVIRLAHIHESLFQAIYC